MYDCPSCDRSFDSKRGRAVHHSQGHGERLPNRTCARCGDRFHSEYEKKYCTQACLDEISFEGENAPNFQGKKRSTQCVLCGATFEYYPSEKVGLYCADCVESEAWRKPPSLDGKRNPRWSGGKLELECTVCAELIRRYPSNATGEAVLCSEECRRSWLSDSFTGEGHPNWKGGGNEAYGTGWYATRRAALERDDYACVRCGTDREDLGRNPDVHHLVPVRVYIESNEFEKVDAHRLDNVATLCPPCHRKADFGHIDPDRLRELTGIDRSTSAPAGPTEVA
ncbi:HNH endonuclease [Halovivax gelatinilyticus]|uniref:HNH endonuclease n=1 Tax=Halovivax gelatinilyticus TaxID=2961597 RepID=UPI0020CA41CA|nr:HNH endonuclease [Halovivax gelatinilyticus]